MASDPTIVARYQALIRQWLTEAEIFFVEQKEKHAFVVAHGSALVIVVIEAESEEDAKLLLRAPLAIGAEIEPALMEYLLRENARRMVGAFGIDSENVIVLDHTLMAASMSQNEFLIALGNLAISADEYDDQIISRFGGMRATDLYQSG